MSNEISSSNQVKPAAAPAKGAWEAPTIEELDYSATETGSTANTDGPYQS